jgi:hypothetical protein
VLEGEREQFLQQSCANQVKRKRHVKTHFLDAASPTRYSLCHGTLPICWKALSYLTGVSTSLLQAVGQTPRAR